MPILTPCAEAGPAIKRPPIAPAASHTDFIGCSPKFLLPAVDSHSDAFSSREPATTSLENAMYYNPATASLFNGANGITGPGPRVGNAANHHVEDRREDQPEQGDPEHPEEHRDPDRLAHFGTRAGRHHQRQHAEDKRKRRHQDRTQPQAAGLDHGFQPLAALVLDVAGEFDDQDRVL